MKGFKQCDQGHFYKETLSSCNYCGDDNGNTKKDHSDTIDHHTVPVSSSDTATSTQANSNHDKTQVYDGSEQSSTQAYSGETNTPPTEPNFNPDVTVIGGLSGDTEMGGKENEGAKSLRRKLKGWIVTFDLKPYGMDFKILEGNNHIGKSASNEITVIDPKVSSKHCVILYRPHDKAFYIKDSMSSNGTFLNGESLRPDQASEIKDGDKIQIGDTEFLFRTAY